VLSPEDLQNVLVAPGIRPATGHVLAFGHG
jgi:hypothetical protein